MKWWPAPAANARCKAVSDGATARGLVVLQEAPGASLVACSGAGLRVVPPALSEPFRQEFASRETYYFPEETGFHSLPGAKPCRLALPAHKKPRLPSSSF
jgi:hypothetical protein